MAKKGGAETVTLDVFRQLRTDIITGRLAPGVRVNTADVRARFAVSAGVLREAITRLEMRGLLRVEPNKGVYVPSLSREELRNLTEARLLNETAALRKAVARGDVQWETALVASHHKMARAAETDADTVNHRNIEMVDAHLDFHLQLVNGCANPVLIEICARLQDAAELYRSWAKTTAADSGRKRDVAAEHRGLLEAALARDADLLAERFETHISRTAELVLAVAHA